MKIGGLQKVSLIDYPGRISAIVFSQGCNFRCPYCHNPELVSPDLYGPCIPEEEILRFLEKRRGKLDAVTITGGEPTIQPDLAGFIKKVRSKDYLIKIDTNGSNPDLLEKLIGSKLINYIAMDIKGPLARYGKITGTHIQPEIIKRSIKTIMNSGIPYEFRTTVVKPLLREDDIFEIGKLIRNARLYVLQSFIPSKHLDVKYVKKTHYSKENLLSMKEKLDKEILSVVVR
jgi:pyruvate formate lyase activating enzyme